jgi:hypothetical protein
MPDRKFGELVRRLRLRWLEDTDDLRELKLKRWRQGAKEKNGHLSSRGSRFFEDRAELRSNNYLIN